MPTLFVRYGWDKIIVSLALLLLSGCSPPMVTALPGAPAADTADAPPAPETSPRPPAKKVARPIEAIDRVLIISIDGLRPDLALRAYMPRVRALCASGSYTFWAETTAEAYTLPCHVSMLTGVSSDKHGVTWNDYIEEAYPNSPTLFELAHEVGYTTALATGKMKFITLLKPLEGAHSSEETIKGTADNLLIFQRPSFRASNTVDHFYIPTTEPVTDQRVAAEAVRIVREHRPELFFVHLPGVDTVGHEHGWGTRQQLTAIEQADSAVGQVLDAVAELELNDSTLIILTADHGGAGLDHQAGDARAHYIPWIISGPGIRRDYDLTLTERPIHIEDTFATASAFLGIESESPHRGTPVMEIIESHKLSSVGNILRRIRGRGAEFTANSRSRAE